MQVLNFLLWTGLIIALGFLVYEFAQKLIDVRAWQFTRPLYTPPPTTPAATNQIACRAGKFCAAKL